MQGSRGARRYLPPGPIDNYSLMSPASSREQLDATALRNNVVVSIGSMDGGTAMQEQQQTECDSDGTACHRLVLGEDYYVVNFNVWQYWSMIYGGECIIACLCASSSWHIYYQN